MTPTLYMSNAASRLPPFRGPGRVLTIMARPRPLYGEAGVGSVPLLIPPWEWVEGAKAGTLDWTEYRRRYLAELELSRSRGDLSPGNLYTRIPYDPRFGAVEDGDTLICACSREAAAAGRCHRVWAGEALRSAGWAVVLDGELLP